MDVQFTLETIQEAAGQFWKTVGDARVFAFHAPMGAGKTTFIHALCQQLKVSSAVSSPTFALINEYNYPGGSLYHLDLYRLKDEEEAIQAGVEDCLYSQQICLVEWPERAPGIFPENTVHVYLEIIDSFTRSLRIGQK